MDKRDNLGDFLFLAMSATILLIILFPDGIDLVMDALIKAASKMLKLFDECATQYLIFRGNVMTHQEMKEDVELNSETD